MFRRYTYLHGVTCNTVIVTDMDTRESGSSLLRNVASRGLFGALF